MGIVFTMYGKRTEQVSTIAPFGWPKGFFGGWGCEDRHNVPELQLAIPFIARLFLAFDAIKRGAGLFKVHSRGLPGEGFGRLYSGRTFNSIS